jgi:hypothetical protein
VRDWCRSALGAEEDEPVVAAGATEEVADLLAAVRRQRATELLHPCAEALGVPPRLAVAVADLRTAGRRAAMVRSLEQARLGVALDEAGIRWLTIKGSALATQTTGDPAGRGPGDIDVLVHPGAVAGVYALLHDLGWVARPLGSATPGTWAWRHILDTFHEMTFDSPAGTVDLHWRLDPTHDALPSFDPLWDRRRQVELLGSTAWTLSPPDALAHTCHHAARDDWRWLRSLFDVRRLARDPAAWGDGAPAPIAIATLRVTADLVGLPGSTPRPVLDRLRSVPEMTVRRAVAAQDRPVIAAHPFPAAQTLRDVRYRLAASHTPRDVRCTAVSAVLPPKGVAGLDDSTVRTALPRAVLLRLRWLVRRSVAWMRRVPGASVVQTTGQR